jgi:hypothetical protein
MNWLFDPFLLLLHQRLSFIKTPRIKYITHADYYRQHKINEREKRAIEAISNGPRDVEIVYDVHSVCVYMFV